MGKSALDNTNSFSKHAHSPSTASSRSASFRDTNIAPSSTSDQNHHSSCKSISEEFEFDPSSRAQVTEDVDHFTNTLSSIQDKSSCPPTIPDSVETFSKIVESRIARYNSGDNGNLFGKMTEEDSFFIEAVNRISKLTNSLSEFSSHDATNSSLNRTSVVLQRAMAFLEEEFRALLEDSRNSPDLDVRSHSAAQQDHPQDRCAIRDPDPVEPEDYPGYPPDFVMKMHRIATTMVTAGYETECCQVYSISRRNAIRIQMKKLEFETINMDDALRMPWESLEKEIWRWTKVVKRCSDTIFPGEKKLGEYVFANYPMICNSMFSNLARAVVIQLLDFAEAAAMAKRSAEKLFKFLDMFEALQSLTKSLGGGESCSDEIAATTNRIGASAASNFCELENSIKSDVARTPVPGGAVHPLTRYVMNYLEYACEYKDALEKIFEKHGDVENKSFPPSSLSHHELEKDSDSPHNFDIAATTPFSIQVITVMDLLDGNLDAKAKLYRDPALRNVFLMNNGRYILQKVKGSNEIRQVMGDTWCRKRSTVVRQYHKNYQRETWNRVLQCLSHDGLLTNGKINKPLLKDRFKIFTNTFDEIHRSQCTWVVSDEQLQSELRISVSAVVIPAYRAFVGRFKQYLDSSKHLDKYIKYQPEDIETLIEGLFEGNATSMARRRT